MGGRGLAGSQFLEGFAGKEGGNFFEEGVAVFTEKINEISNI